jgi:branched-chain amino acid aminotransferase
MSGGLVWTDAGIVPAADVKIGIADHGLLYGDGVFEGMRVYGGAVSRLDDHLARLATSAKVLGLPIPGGLAHVRAAVLETVRAYGAGEAYIRLILTRGEGALGVDPSTCRAPRLLCWVDELRLHPEAIRARGLDLVTSSWRRPPPDVLDPRVKSLNYLNSVLSHREAKLRGGDEALILNLAGNIAEAAVANLFVVRDGALATPPTTDGALDGVTRRSVLELARDLGMPAAERTLGRIDLHGADEAFLTGSGAGLVPIRSLDGQALAGTPPGPVFRKLRAAFLDAAPGWGVPALAPHGHQAM